MKIVTHPYFLKAKKVVESCTNDKQLDVAENYIKLAAHKFAEESCDEKNKILRALQKSKIREKFYKYLYEAVTGQDLPKYKNPYYALERKGRNYVSKNKKEKTCK